MPEFNIYDSPIFEGVDEKYLQEFLSSTEQVTIKQGEYLFRQNDLGDSMFIVESGQLEVILKSKKVDTIDCGKLIGELCVFGQEKRSASIRALTDSQLIKIEGEDFRTRLYSKELDALLICYNIAKILTQRLINANILLEIL